ncbi:hypothetical protein SAMN05216214_1381 [Atopomonas hussainii]|uniref:Uncharacterized protein n=1 Tax=Atopomonas hussainii TaxID=1429083 RepID=A0A1H7TKE2_9GAMM|nr:hypothetical protein [Atopomonas hussainii]SEL84949.1 hypothetical protein SAMN05216214_1381 [Atopomonas hussainii]
MTSRLSTVDPHIENTLSDLPIEKRTALASSVVLWVVREAGLDCLAIEKAINEMRHDQLQEIAIQSDENYLKQQELGNFEHLDFFSKARAYSAASFLAQGKIYEAIYEAIMATDEPEKILKHLQGGEA